MPVDRLGQRPAGEQPERSAARDHEGEDAHGLGALLGSRKSCDQDGDDDARRHRPANALQRPRRDQRDRVWREPIQTRGHREDDHTGEEDLLPADQVARAPGQEQQAAIGDQIGVHHPREVRLREVQVALDRGQGDVHDRRIEHDHELAQAHHEQGKPPPDLVLSSAVHNAS